MYGTKDSPGRTPASCFFFRISVLTRLLVSVVYPEQLIPDPIKFINTYCNFKMEKSVLSFDLLFMYIYILYIMLCYRCI